ncbi:hypothetical protein KY285_007017 [Solanum tuberosum]|nr:hypothetical protein KY285_007017 [Solanum tuberosum]
MAQMKLPHLLLLLLVVFPSFSSAKISVLPLRFASKQAEKLIRELNLFPKESDNIVDRDPFQTDDEGSRIVEKRFSFPNLANSSVSFEDLGHHAGYYKIKHSHAASSELALFYENGPFSISKKLSLAPNEYGWDKKKACAQAMVAVYLLAFYSMVQLDCNKTFSCFYSVIYESTGFSYSSDRPDLCHTETCVSDDLYDFIQAFFEEHPELVKNDFYITGESYAGHYIPAFAARVHKGNKGKEGTHINLKGFAIGNGLTDPKIQYPAYTDYALDMGLISKSTHDRINKLIPVCEVAVNLCGTDGKVSCLAAYFVCNSIFTAVRASAGVEINALLVDWMRNSEVGIPTLLEDGIKLPVYAGEYDLICNWLGNSRWVQAMELKGQKEFVASTEVPFEVSGSEAGLLRSHGPLSFLKVHDDTWFQWISLKLP